MKRFKKLLATVITFAMVIGMVNTMPATIAKAADANPIDYLVDYYEHTMTVIAAGTDTMVFVGVAGKDGKVKTYDVFDVDNNEAIIDLSSFVTTKEWDLRVHGDVNTTDVTVKLTKAAAKIKATYTPKGASIADMIKVEVDGVAAALSKIEFRTASGEWDSCSNLTPSNVETYSVFGATLYLRVAAASTTSGAAVTGNFISKEGKLKISKKANAPKATIDYSKFTIKLPKNVEYRVAHTATWTAAEAAGGVKKFSDLGIVNTASVVNFEMRTVASDTKSASKIGITEIAVQPAVASGAAIEFKNEVDSKTGNTKKFEITNKSSSILEYFISASASPTIDFTTQKWSKLAVGKSATIGAADKDKYIIYRIAAGKTTDKVSYFASAWSATDKVVFTVSGAAVASGSAAQ